MDSKTGSETSQAMAVVIQERDDDILNWESGSGDGLCGEISQSYLGVKTISD